jgi:hypothetical protein
VEQPVIFFQMLVQSIESLGADLLFGLVVLTSFGLTILAVMFFLLAVRALFTLMRCWLIGHTWNDVVASAGRKALK